MTVEPDANLRRDVGQQERFIHGFLGQLGICRGDHVPPVVPTSEVILQFGTEYRRYTFILREVALRPVASVRTFGARIFAQNRLGQVFCCLFPGSEKRIWVRTA